MSDCNHIYVLSFPDEGYSRNVSCASNSLSMLLLFRDDKS